MTTNHYLLRRFATALITCASITVFAAKPVEIAEFEKIAKEFHGASATARGQIAERLKTKLEKRNQRFLKLMRENPADSIIFTLPHGIKKSLPEDIKSRLESVVSGRGSLKVLIARNESEGPQIRNEVEIDGKRYVAHVYGRRKYQTGDRLPIHGVAMGREIALSENPVRVLEQSEVEELRNKGLRISGVCPISGRGIDKLKEPDSYTVDVGGEYHYVCQGGDIHIDQLNSQYIAQEGGSLAASCGNTARSTSWTTGNKTMLYIRVNYPDDLTDPQTLASAQSMMTGMNTYFRDSSYGALGVTGTFPPLLTLPKTKVEYNAMSDKGDYAILSDAIAAAKAAGYDINQYNFYAVRFQGAGGGYSGMAYVGSTGIWLKSSSVGVFAHEFGHNLGLWHSNSWTPATADPMSLTGTNKEYGNIYSVMGGASGMGHFTSYEKKMLGWLPSGSSYNIAARADSPSQSFDLQLYAFDDPNFKSDLPYSVEINAYRPWSLDFRLKNANAAKGVQVHFKPWSGSRCGVQIIDTTYGSAGGLADAVVPFGSTFTDPLTGISISPVARLGTTPETIDLGIDLANVAPVATRLDITGSTSNIATNSQRQFTAAAYDQFGYALGQGSYSWFASGGTIDANGLWTVPSVPGTHTVWASAGGLVSAKLTISVIELGISSIAISPLNPTLNVGSSVTFKASVKDQFGALISPQPTVTWSASGGSISSAGVFSAPVAGSFQITAAVGSINSKTTATVNGPTEPIVVSIASPLANSVYKLNQIIPVSVQTSSNVVKVSIMSGTKSVCTSSVAPFTCQWGPLKKAGKYTIEAVAYDAKGFSSKSSPVIVNVQR